MSGMWPYSALLGHGGGGSPVPTNPTRTYIDGSGTKFGLAIGNGNTGSVNSMGALIGLGTTTAALQGIYLQAQTGFNRESALSLYFNSVLVASWLPFSSSSAGLFAIPIPVPASTVVEATVATNTSVACSVMPHPYQSNVSAPASSLAALGKHTNVFDQGATLSTADTWGLIGSLAADAYALSISIGMGGVSSGRLSKNSYVDIGISSAAGSTPDSVILADLFCLGTSNNIAMGDHGPFPIQGLTAGTKVYARAIDTDGVLGNPLSVQAVAFYK